MNVGIFVLCEAAVANLSSVLCFEHSFYRSACGKNAVRIVVPNYFVELQKIDAIGLKAAQRVADLARSRSFRAPVDLGHEKCFLPIAVAQRVAHAYFAIAAIVIPAVVEKINSFIQPAADNSYTFLRIRLLAKMIATEADDRDFLVGMAQPSIGNTISGFRAQGIFASVR